MSTDLLPRPPITADTAGHGSTFGRVVARFRARQAERRYLEDCTRYVKALTWEFRDTCEGLGIAQRIDTPTGPLARVPRVGQVEVGPPTTVMVELMPGQEPGDLARQGRRLAHSLGFASLRVEPVALRWVRVVLLDVDPLARSFQLPDVVVDTASALLLLARDEHGDTLGHAVADAVHLAIQGITRSGKSSFVYALLAQLVAADDVVVAGIDHTDLLLGRPWEGTAHRAWQSTGSTEDDIRAHADHLDALVENLRARRVRLGRYEDKVTTGPDLPVIVVVLEEFPQLLDLADALPKPKEGKKVGDRLRMAVKALVAEGGKYGARVIMLAQRFEATEVGGGFIRDQFALRLSFAVPKGSLVLLHDRDAVEELQDDHSVAEKGVAVLSSPGRRLTRVRVPHLPSYREYVQRIEALGRPA